MILLDATQTAEITTTAATWMFTTTSEFTTEITTTTEGSSRIWPYPVLTVLGLILASILAILLFIVIVILIVKLVAFCIALSLCCKDRNRQNEVNAVVVLPPEAVEVVQDCPSYESISSDCKSNEDVITHQVGK